MTGYLLCSLMVVNILKVVIPVVQSTTFLPTQLVVNNVYLVETTEPPDAH